MEAIAEKIRRMEKRRAVLEKSIIKKISVTLIIITLIGCTKQSSVIISSPEVL
jgi:hypothetical protein